MLSLTPIIALIKPDTIQVDKWFRHVGGDLEYVSLDSNNLPPRTAYVLPVNDTSTASDEMADVIEVRFEVVTVVDRPVKRNDGKADDESRAYRFEVYRRLRGKKPADDCSEIFYSGGRLVRSTTKDIVWADTYRFSGSLDAYLENPPLFESVDYQGANT